MRRVSLRRASGTNRAARVLTGWQRDGDFLDDNGSPRSLRDEGRAALTG